MEAAQRLAIALMLTVACCSMTTRQETTLTCDLQDVAQQLTCGSGLIVVHNVTASHRESEACVDGVPPNHLDTPLCSPTPLLDIAKARCNGRYRCALPMDLCHAARPCLTRCVWMRTTHTCEAGRIRHVCQRQRTALSCGSQVIRVLMANYGRTSQKVCQYSAPRSQPPSTACRSSEALKLMADRCDGRRRCSVRASNLVFSDLCPGTRKYLQYSYTCEHPGTPGR